MIWVKQHGDLVAACDQDVLAAKPEGVSEYFFKGQLMEPKELVEMLKTATNVNLLGKEATRVGEEAGIVSKVGSLRGIPFAISVTL